MPLEALNQVEHDLNKSVQSCGPNYDDEQEGDQSHSQQHGAVHDAVNQAKPTKNPPTTPNVSQTKPDTPRTKPEFIPTPTLSQQVVTDWIAGCVEMMNTKRKESVAGQDKKQQPNANISFPTDPIPSPPNLTFPPSLFSSSPQATAIPGPTTLSPKEFLSYSQTLSGSQSLQRVLTSGSGDQKTKDSIFQSGTSIRTPTELEVMMPSWMMGHFIGYNETMKPIKEIENKEGIVIQVHINN